MLRYIDYSIGIASEYFTADASLRAGRADPDHHADHDEDRLHDPDALAIDIYCSNS
jgi:hypothetical protein